MNKKPLAPAGLDAHRDWSWPCLCPDPPDRKFSDERRREESSTTAALARVLVLADTDDDSISVGLALAAEGHPTALASLTDEEHWRAAMQASDFDVVIACVHGPAHAPGLTALIAAANNSGASVIVVADALADVASASSSDKTLVCLRCLGPSQLVGAVQQAHATATTHSVLAVLRELRARASEAVAEQRRLEQLVFRSQRLESVGVLAAGLAHDFNNLLMVISANSELALSGLDAHSSARDAVLQIEAASARATGLVRRLLTLSRERETTRHAVDLELLVREALSLLQVWMKPSSRIQTRFEPNLPRLVGDPTQLHQLIMNLVTNASHAVACKGGTIHVCVEHAKITGTLESRFGDLRAGNYLRLSVADNGAGMDRATLARIFDPFFTTRELGKGSGLGLAVVQAIVKGHGGGVIVHSEPSSGTTFEVYLPVPGALDELREPG